MDGAATFAALFRESTCRITIDYSIPLSYVILLLDTKNTG